MNFSYPIELEEWISENDLWVRTMASVVTKNSPELLYWEQVSLTLSQFDGIYEGSIFLTKY